MVPLGERQKVRGVSAAREPSHLHHARVGSSLIEMVASLSGGCGLWKTATTPPHQPLLHWVVRRHYSRTHPASGAREPGCVTCTGLSHCGRRALPCSGPEAPFPQSKAQSGGKYTLVSQPHDPSPPSQRTAVAMQHSCDARRGNCIASASH